MTTNTDKIEVAYTDREALDEAVRLFTRRMRRLHTDAFNAVMVSLPDGAREALNAADIRADTLMHSDAKNTDMIRTWPTAYEIDTDDAGLCTDTNCPMAWAEHPAH